MQGIDASDGVPPPREEVGISPQPVGEPLVPVVQHIGGHLRRRGGGVGGGGQHGWPVAAGQRLQRAKRLAAVSCSRPSPEPVEGRGMCWLQISVCPP